MRRALPLLLFPALAAALGALPKGGSEKPSWSRPLKNTTFERTKIRRERGRYLAEGVLQCFNCHSDRDPLRPGMPPVDGRKGAGHVWYDEPGARLVSPNITPDAETGAGRWTDDMLARAIREGVGHDGRPLHPQMWYDAFGSLSDSDVAAVVVYLRSIPPVKNRLPPTLLKAGRASSIEGTLRPLTSPVAAPDVSTPVKRGRYLTQVANCQGCHTAWEAPLNPGRFGGGNFVELTIGGKKLARFSRNLTSDSSGIPYYDDALFIGAMRTGKVRTRELSPLMPWTVFRNMTDDDLKAVRAYLTSLLPVRHLIDPDEPEGLCPVCGQKHGAGKLNATKESRAIPIDPNSIDGCEGEYRFPDAPPIVLVRENGRLFARAGNQKDEVFTEDNRLFFTKTAPDVVEFVRDRSGRVTKVIDRAFDDDVGMKVSPSPSR